MLKQSFIGLSMFLGSVCYGVTATAQSNDMSPVLFLESAPSDNSEYRRMMTLSYLQGNRARVTYRAYNRTEFKQIPSGNGANEILAKCANGPATALREIQAFERAEARRKRNGQPVEVKTFCIKNVSGWESRGNRKKYLDPIFNGMPYAATLK